MVAIYHEWVGSEMTVFAERLRVFRTARKLSQSRLSELLGVSPRVYNRWERGVAAPHLDTTVKIADILQVSLDELVGRVEPTQKAVIHNHHLHALCQQVDQLTDEDQKALIILMDSLVKRSQVAKLLAS